MLLYYGFPSNIFNPVLLNLQRCNAQIQRVNYALFCMPDVYTLIFPGLRHIQQAIKFPLLDFFPLASMDGLPTEGAALTNVGLRWSLRKWASCEPPALSWSEPNYLPSFVLRFASFSENRFLPGPRIKAAWHLPSVSLFLLGKIKPSWVDALWTMAKEQSETALPGHTAVPASASGFLSNTRLWPSRGQELHRGGWKRSEMNEETTGSREHPVWGSKARCEVSGFRKGRSSKVQSCTPINNLYG